MIENNNPGNIRFKGYPWNGSCGSKFGFVVFESPMYGLKALARLIHTYMTKHKLRTISEIIDRYAPPTENDTKNYIREVSEYCSYPPDEEISINDVSLICDLIAAIVQEESSAAKFFTDNEYIIAVTYAGFAPNV